MIHQKIKVKILWFHELFLSCSLVFPESKKLSKKQQYFKTCIRINNWIKNHEIILYNLKSVSTLQTHEITNHKLRKAELFPLYYMCCMSYFCTKKRKHNILHNYSQNNHLLIFAFLFHLFYFQTIWRFCFP